MAPLVEGGVAPVAAELAEVELRGSGDGTFCGGGGLHLHAPVSAPVSAEISAETGVEAAHAVATEACVATVVSSVAFNAVGVELFEVFALVFSVEKKDGSRTLGGGRANLLDVLCVKLVCMYKCKGYVKTQATL